MNLFDLCVYKNLNKGSGGDVDVSSLVATENKTYNAGEGKAYNPVVVNVPTPSPSLQSLTASHNGYFVPSSGYDGFSEVEVYVPYVTQGTTIYENGTYTPPSGVDGFGRVIVDVPTPPPSLQSLTASHNGYFVPSSGYVGFSEVNVDVALPQNAYLLESQKDDVVTIQHGAEFDMPKLIASIEPQQSGSGDPSPENVRPISGWTACNVVRTGKNLVYKTISKATVSSNGEFVIASSVNSDMQIAQVKKDKVYTITSDELFVGGFFTSEPTNGSVTYNNSRWEDTPKTFTSPIDGYVAFRTSNGYATPQMEIGTQSTTYEEYNGNTYTINFVDGSNPLIVYGGTLNVLTGLLTVDRAYVDLGDLTWTYSSSSGRSLFTSNDITDYKHTGSNDIAVNAISECFVNIPMSAIFKNGQMGMDGVEERNRIIICDNRYTDATAFKTAMSGVQLVYELATPQTYQLTPTEVKSLLYLNQIWANTGNVLNAEYVRDTTTIINQILARLDALES